MNPELGPQHAGWPNTAGVILPILVIHQMMGLHGHGALQPQPAIAIPQLSINADNSGLGDLNSPTAAVSCSCLGDTATDDPRADQ